MANPEIISESFRVWLDKLEYVDYIKSDEQEFRWLLSPDGSLMIYKVQYHKTFSSAVIKDERHVCYASGSWLKVEILNDKED